MMRMIKMEFVVFGQYLRQLTFSIAFIAVCFAAGTGSTASLPAIIFNLGMFSLSNGASNYDEQNNWAAFRLAMPVSRRDVVVGRYAFALLGAAAVTAIVTAITLALGALVDVVPMPEMLADILRITPEGVRSGALALGMCGVMGMLIASVCMPVFFKFGQTKATQWLPCIMMFIGVAPFVLVRFLRDDAIRVLQSVLSFVEAPGGLAAFMFGAFAIALAVYAASMAISLRVYQARDL